MVSAEKTGALHAALASSAPKPTPPEECCFVHLHAHSAYSLLEGALPIKRLLELALADNQPALAVTDRNNLFGALEFSEKAAGEGIQPIVGCKLAIDFEDGKDHQSKTGLENYPYLVLIAANEEGFANLRILVSKAHLANDSHGLPHVSIKNLLSHSSGLICLSGGDDGPLNQLAAEGRRDDVQARMSVLKGSFGDRLYIELQRHDSQSRSTEIVLLDLAYDLGIPLVATNQPYFAQREDYEAHDALLCIEEGTVIAVEERKRLTEDHYFKAQSEMAALFADLPEAWKTPWKSRAAAVFVNVPACPFYPDLLKVLRGPVTKKQYKQNPKS